MVRDNGRLPLPKKHIVDIDGGRCFRYLTAGVCENYGKWKRSSPPLEVVVLYMDQRQTKSAFQGEVRMFDMKETRGCSVILTAQICRR